MSIKLLENASFALMRTNPKLTTNVKVVANSKGELFLESFNANTELSKSKFKSFRVSSESSYEYDLNRFYNNGKTPRDIIFDVYRENSDLQVHSDFSKQYEFNYAYGATSVNSKSHDEEFSILAPIWLEDSIPNYFIVFRLDGPVSINNSEINSENENKDYTNNPYNFIDVVLKNSKIIKTFDLSEKSEQGKYMRNFRRSEGFPRAPLIFSTEREESTLWQGIDIENGGFVSKGEYVYDRLFGTDSTIIENEHFITQGFERNKVALANILNMEFLFDDEDAENFTINRYFGLYVNSIPEGSFQIDGSKLVKGHYSQTPYAKSTDYITPDNTKDFEQFNKNGIVLPILEESVNSNYIVGDITNDGINDLDHSDFLPKTSDVNELTSFFYVKDKNGDFYNLKTGSNWNDGSEVRISNNKINWSNFTGHNSPVLTITGTNCAKPRGHASTFLTVNGNIPHGDKYVAGIVKKQSYKFTSNNVIPGDIITISDGIDTISINVVNSNIETLMNSIKTAWDNSGFNNFNKFLTSVKDNEFIIIEKESSGIDIDFIITSSSSNFNIVQIDSASTESFTITADNTLNINPGEAVGRFFKPIGTTNEIAEAMVAAFNNIKDKFYNATRVGNKVVLVAKSGGSRFNDIIIARDKFLSSGHVEILSNTKGFYHPQLDIYKFEGGSETSDSRIAVDIKSFESFNKSGRYLQVLNKSGDSNTIKPIKKVSYYIDEPIYNKLGDIIGYKDFDKYCTVNVEDGETIYRDNYKKIYLYDLINIEYGRFSIFPIKDMDFDFYSTEYGDKKELEIEKEYYSEWNELSTNTHKDIEDFYENKDFSTLESLLETEDSDSELTSTEIMCEYDRLNENSIKELSIPSRITPYINKWVYRNGKNVREVDYRLNTSEAFGINNFAPSMDEHERSPDNFTHEWYYLQKLPPYFGKFEPNVLNKVFSYFPEKIDTSNTGLKSVDYDYFTDYFTVDMLKHPILNTSNSAIISEFNVAVDKQLRYSLFEGGSYDDFATAFHRGVKVIVKERIENDVKINYNLQNIKLKKDTRFNNYKFSCVLIPHDGKYNGEFKKRTEIEFLENRKFKTITLLIYAELNDITNLLTREVSGGNIYEAGAFIDRTLLYTLNSKLISIDPNDLNTAGDMEYADIELSGSIDLRPSSGTIFSNSGSGKVHGTEDISGDSSKFLDEVTLNEEGSYNTINAKSGHVDIDFEVTDVLSNNVLKATNFSGGPQPSGLSDIMVKTGVYTYRLGGYNYWNSKLNNISFGSIAELINNGAPEIKYTTIDKDGMLIKDLFIVELQTPNAIIKPNYLKSISDSNKPVNFNLSKEIGHELTYRDRANVQPMFRHGGFYQPKFIDIIKFEDPYVIKEYSNKLERDSQIKSYLKNLNSQIKINDDFAKIKNLFYHKVNDNNSNGILELTSGSAFKPLYPFIGEIAIDKQDFYLWKSNWDSAYFKRHITKTQTENVIGTRAVKENKSFFASKVMKILDSIIIDTFDNIMAINKEELKILGDDINHPDNEYELVWHDDGQQIILDVYLEKRLIEVLSNSNIKKFFIKYIKPEYGYGKYSTLDDDVLEYIRINILPRYSIGSIDLYVNKSKDIDFNQQYPKINSLIPNNIKELNGLIISNEFNYTKLNSSSNFNIRMIYNKIEGFNYSIAPSFKIIKK